MLFDLGVRDVVLGRAYGRGQALALKAQGGDDAAAMGRGRPRPDSLAKGLDATIDASQANDGQAAEKARERGIEDLAVGPAVLRREEV